MQQQSSMEFESSLPILYLTAWLDFNFSTDCHSLFKGLLVIMTRKANILWAKNVYFCFYETRKVGQRQAINSLHRDYYCRAAILASARVVTRAWAGGRMHKHRTDFGAQPRTQSSYHIATVQNPLCFARKASWIQIRTNCSVSPMESNAWRPFQK